MSKEKDEQLIKLQQSENYLEDKVRDLEKELEFEREMSRVAQQNLKEKEEEMLQKSQIIEEEKKKDAQSKKSEDTARLAEQLKQSNEVLTQQNQLFERQLRKLQQDFQCQMIIEQELRTKSEQSLNQIRQQEFLLRQKQEETATIRKHLEAAQLEMKNQGWLES